jgi:hypothetical protein
MYGILFGIRLIQKSAKHIFVLEEEEDRQAPALIGK